MAYDSAGVNENLMIHLDMACIGLLTQEALPYLKTNTLPASSINIFYAGAGENWCLQADQGWSQGVCWCFQKTVSGNIYIIR